MPKKDWKEEFKKLTYSKGTDALKMEIAPYRDWRIVALLFFCALVGSFAFNIYMSIEINSDNFFTAEIKQTGVTKFNEDGIAKIVSGIDEKATRFEKVVKEGVVAVDPSL